MHIPLLPFPCRNCGVPMCSAKYRPPPGSYFLKHKGRKLCSGCYSANRNYGTLEQFPRSTRRREQTYREWLDLEEQGMTPVEAARHLGIKYVTFERMRLMGNARRREEEKTMAKSHKDTGKAPRTAPGGVVNIVEGENNGDIIQHGDGAGAVNNIARGVNNGMIIQAGNVQGGINLSHRR